MELVLDECNPATRGAKTWIMYLCKCARDRYLMIWQVGVLSIGDWLPKVQSMTWGAPVDETRCAIVTVRLGTLGK